MGQTIFALATGHGRSAVAIVRISGTLAETAGLAFCGRSLKPRFAELVTLRDPQSKVELDRSLVIWFPGPFSFTGEDCLEFHLHGGRAVINAVLRALAKQPGFRLAEPGEFTRRAFSNGKLDLNSAEGLADLIEADTEVQRRQALHQLKGATAELVVKWRSSLIELRSLIEAHLDFSDQEDVPPESESYIVARLEDLRIEFISALLNSERGERIKDGLIAVIAGPPNAGKSTLMNALAKRDVSLVSDQPGTTRDVIEVQMDLHGCPVILMDTAGLRSTDEVMEAAGISRSLDRIERADVVIWLQPAGVPKVDSDISFSTKRLLVTSKIDTISSPHEGLGVSALTGRGIDSLLEALSTLASERLGGGESFPMLRARQREFVQGAQRDIESAQKRLHEGMLELVAEDLMFACRRIELLTERIDVDDVLDGIFSRFCIGK